MRARLWLATLTCALFLTATGVATWVIEPSSSQSTSEPTLRYIQTTLSDIGGQKEAEAAGIGSPEPAPDGETMWSVTATVPPSDKRENQTLVPTAHGPIAILTIPPSSDPEKAERVMPTHASVAGLDPDTGKIRWYRSVTPAVDFDHDGSLWRAFDLPSEIISVSADGEYAAFRLDLQPTGHNDDDIFSDGPTPSPSQAVVVLSTKTGELVRKVETTGDNVLGQALTNDSLVILTSSTYHPEGGQISAYPLTDSEAPADSWEATGWLAGATADSAILSSTVERQPCNPSRCLNATVTLNDPTTGAVQDTYDRVTTIHPDGGIERLTDGQTPPTPDDEASWNAAHRELVDLHTGTTTDITGHEVSVTVTPTGRAWLLSTPKTDKQGTTARSWLPIGSTNPDGASTTPSTNPLETITKGPTYENSKHLALIERTTLTMTAGG
ncbi:hypothetical protein ACSL103130_01070 [Actinomyces slackii]|uniref:Uncharacterized protein n=2 Tax=Actinomyces slackii TaxID=52774 RepID=A0A3S4SNE8_9ACTO|nr:Uncharacterised protein [Actinomyces slackii]